MRVLGIRCESSAITCAVLEGNLEAPVLVCIEQAKMPTTYDFAKGANFLRMRLTAILAANMVIKVGVRTPESVRQLTESFRERLRVEGVMLAACAETGVTVTQGPLATMSRLLGVKSAKVLLESDDYRGIDLAKLTPIKREAILMGASLLESES